MATLERRTRAGGNPIKAAWMITDMSTERSERLPQFHTSTFPLRSRPGSVCAAESSARTEKIQSENQRSGHHWSQNNPSQCR